MKDETLRRQCKISVFKATFKRALQQLFICLRPPPLLGFSLVVVSNFVGSESGHIQSLKILQNTVSQAPPPPATHCLEFT
jgi:hypothetical protein